MLSILTYFVNTYTLYSLVLLRHFNDELRKLRFMIQYFTSIFICNISLDYIHILLHHMNYISYDLFFRSEHFISICLCSIIIDSIDVLLYYIFYIKIVTMLLITIFAIKEYKLINE